jgi:hypothetical protein
LHRRIPCHNAAFGLNIASAALRADGTTRERERASTTNYAPAGQAVYVGGPPTFRLVLRLGDRVMDPCAALPGLVLRTNVPRMTLSMPNPPPPLHVGRRRRLCHPSCQWHPRHLGHLRRWSPVVPAHHAGRRPVPRSTRFAWDPG